MNSEQTGENPKQPYEKPRLRTIELSAEEVMAVGCKMVSGAKGFRHFAINTCILFRPCWRPGS